MELPTSSEPEVGSVGRFIKQGLFVYLRPYWMQNIFLAFTVILSVLFDAAVPFGLKYLVDAAIIPQDIQMLVLILSSLALLFLITALGDFLQAFVQSRLGVELLKDLRTEFFSHLQNIPISYFDRLQPGEISAFFHKELIIIQSALKGLTVNGLRPVLKLGITVSALLWLDWRLALVVFAILPLTIIVPRRVLRRSTIVASAERNQAAKIAHFVQDIVATQPLIRAYGLEEYVKARFAEKQGRGNNQPAANKSVRFKQALQGAPFLMSMVVVLTDIQQVILNGLAIGIGAFLAVSGTITVGALLAFVAFLGQLKPAMTSLLAYFRDLVWAASALAQLEAILAVPPEVVEMSPAQDLPRLSREIRFEEVSFSYSGQELQLKRNTFSIPAKRLTAIVGRSGAGKSTLIKLLLRFYDPAEGRVLLDGHDLRTVSQASFRSQIGVVFQDIVLLNATIRENICLPKPDATDEDIEAAARAAGIHETVMELPEGYQTLVGERGSQLALGQRQRISLARALLTDPALLLLDEVTSALDPESEAAINATLKKVARERTVISVTHRLPAVMEMDEVIVLDGGQVVEQGQHQTLLERKGLYHKLWQIQTGFIIRANGRSASVSAARLQLIPLFKGLDEPTLAMLAGQFISEYYEAGHILFSERDPGDKFYIIVRGKVSVTSVRSFDQQAVELAVLEDGDYFGEIALEREGGLRTATVQTQLPSLFLTLERKHFESLMANFPTLSAVVHQKSLKRSLDLITSLGRRKRTVTLDDLNLDQ